MIAQIFTPEPIEPMVKAAPPRDSSMIIPYIMMLVGFFIWGLIIYGLIKLIKYLGSAGREQKLIRMELSKLADEVGHIRQELKSGTEQEPLANNEGDQK